MEMRNRPFEFNILVVYLKWTKIVEVDESYQQYEENIQFKKNGFLHILAFWFKRTK
jgi:hypothetical protein